MTEASVDHEQDSTPNTKYYTPDDVSLHNCAEDCWLSLFGQVREITTDVLKVPRRAEAAVGVVCRVWVLLRCTVLVCAVGVVVVTRQREHFRHGCNN